MSDGSDDGGGAPSSFSSMSLSELERVASQVAGCLFLYDGHGAKLVEWTASLSGLPGWLVERVTLATVLKFDSYLGLVEKSLPAGRSDGAPSQPSASSGTRRRRPTSPSSLSPSSPSGAPSAPPPSPPSELPSSATCAAVSSPLLSPSLALPSELPSSSSLTASVSLPSSEVPSETVAPRERGATLERLMETVRGDGSPASQEESLALLAVAQAYSAVLEAGLLTQDGGLNLGWTLGDFAIEGELGEGSYGKVLVARHLKSQRKYALKVNSKDLVVRKKAADIPLREKATSYRVSGHPTIPALLCTFHDATHLYFLSELCEGGELFFLIKKATVLPVDVVRFFAVQLLEGLLHLQSVGVIHRDIKPENLVLTPSGRLKIIDFGTAKIISDVPDRKVVGTSPYMAPEVITSSNAFSFASDMWAFACTVLQMATGVRYFDKGTDYLTMRFILDDEVPPLTTLVEDEELASLLQLILVKDPSLRASVNDALSHSFFHGLTYDDCFSTPWGSSMSEVVADLASRPLPPPKAMQE